MELQDQKHFQCRVQGTSCVERLYSLHQNTAWQRLAPESVSEMIRTIIGQVVLLQAQNENVDAELIASLALSHLETLDLFAI